MSNEIHFDAVSLSSDETGMTLAATDRDGQVWIRHYLNDAGWQGWYPLRFPDEEKGECETV